MVGRDDCAKESLAVLCAVYSVCIIVSLLIYGLWQERIMSTFDGADVFFLSTLLVLVSRVFGFAFAFAMMLITREKVGCTAALWKYVFVAMCTVAASICQFEALNYVCFTVTILGKSIKSLPVMVSGTILNGKRFKPIDWGMGIGVGIGTVLFLAGGSFAPHQPNGNCWYGILMLVGFIVLDGFTASYQEQIFAESSAMKYNQMFYINVAASCIAALVLVCTSTEDNAITLGKEHPLIFVDAAIMSVSALIAQWFVYAQVQEFGALVFAATMNLRQIGSVIASNIWFKHSPTWIQEVGLGIVFAALFIQGAVGLCGAAETEPLLKEHIDKDGAEDVIKLKKTSAANCCMAFKHV